jgi:rhodanese-related sulfurtransferase
MRRRIFLTLMAAALLGAPALVAAAGAQETRPDRITIEEFKALVEGGKPVLALDVRGHIESKIKGAKHVPLDALEARLAELPRGREIVTYCA